MIDSKSAISLFLLLCLLLLLVVVVLLMLMLLMLMTTMMMNMLRTHHLQFLIFCKVDKYFDRFAAAAVAYWVYYC